MSETKACSDFPQPQDFKDILELLDKLSESRTLKNSVGQKLLEDVETYFKDAQKFYQSGSHSEVLSTVFTNAKEIRKSILDTGRTIGTYNKFDRDHASHSNCAEKISEALKKCLPKAYAALYFLLFMGDKSLGGIQGGDWHDYACNGNDYGRGRGYGSKVDLYLWLTDMNGQNSGLVRRGFPQDTHSFTSKKGSEVATQIKTIITHSTAGPLQKVFLYLMFLCSWDDSLLGHAVLFLDKFCEKVAKDREKKNLQGKLKGQSKVQVDALYSLCVHLQIHLYPFTHSSDSGLRAVCHENSDLFEEMWKEDSFGDYVKWLKENLPKIIEALNQMLKDSKRWNRSDLRNASSAGPFKYGFVFKEKWNGSRNRGVQSAITSLLPPLRELQKCLQGSPAPAAQVEHSRSSVVSESHVSSAGSLSSRSGSHASQTAESHEDSQDNSQGDPSEGTSKASIVGASVGTLGGTAALGGLGYFLRGFLFGV